MKKKIVLIVLAVIVLAVVFVPIPNYFKDGGTSTYTSLTYKIIKWNRLLDEDIIYTNTSIYLFPNNFNTDENYWKLEDYENYMKNIGN